MKKKERAEQVKLQIIELQAENKNMNEIMNTMKTKTNQQELIKTMKEEKGIKQILVTEDNTVMKMEMQKLRLEIQREQSEQKERSKEIERLKTEITKMKSEQEKHKMQISTEQKNDKKTLIEITTEKRNLEEQVITLKHLNIQLEKQIMSSKEKTEKEKNVGTVTGAQDETSEKVGHRQSVSRKQKQKGEAIYVIECTGKTINEGQLRQLIKQDGGLRKLEIRKSAECR